MRILALILCSYIAFAQGLVRHTVDLSAFDQNDLNTVVEVQENVGGVKPPLWVLDLDTEDLDSLKLRVASDEEQIEFEHAFGSSIRQAERSRLFGKRRVKKDDPNNPKLNVTEDVSNADREDTEKLKKEITKHVNKFILSTVDLGDETPIYGPSLSLYFKGPYTSLTTKSGRKRWHYFFKPPSPLPAWFYTEHPIGGTVEIPQSIRNTFYASLLRLLQIFLRISP